MFPFLARRALLSLPALFGAATAVFFLLHLVPGNPAALMLGEGARGEDVAALEAKLGLDRPLGEQYLSFLQKLLRGDLGESFRYEAPVASLIAERLPATAELAAASFLFSAALAFALALASVAGRRRADPWIFGGAILAVSVPTFGLGPILLYVFSIRCDFFPVSGRGGAEHLVLPALTLGLAFAAVLSRVLRASLAEALAEDYVRTAKAKGLSPARVLARHALRNALLPTVTLLGVHAGHLFTGAVITETIFAWPGVGRLLFQAIQFRDYPLVQGIVLFTAAAYVAANMLADVAYAALDPRVRRAYGNGR